MVGDVQQDEDGQVPEAGALQLSGVAGVEESLPRGAQVAVMQRLQDAPQVPAETVIQTLPGDRQRVQQLLQVVVSEGKHTQRHNSTGLFWIPETRFLGSDAGKSKVELGT